MIALLGAAASNAAIAQDLQVSLSGGGTARSTRTNDWRFPAISPVVSGGSGVYSYSWTVTPEYGPEIADASWYQCAPAQSCNPRVRANLNCIQTSATLFVTVLDAITGQRASSNPVFYNFSYYIPGPCDLPPAPPPTCGPTIFNCF